jgi:flavodoxin I
MKALVLYDSAYGNTEKVANVIAETARLSAEVRSLLVKDINEADISSADVIFIGSPTQGGRPTPGVQEFLHSIQPELLENKNVAVFDTRFAVDDHGLGLKLLMKSIGFAAPKIAASLAKKGTHILGEPIGFIVNDKEGPLADKELDRASAWTKQTLLQCA